ncbi:hypothetical protein [Paraliomyxa miuraensis]|uniref:hypothetical protein n=1 Tax=Paraliomyxa miuraensis TaxID=376150 RepID=UPI00225741F5|nr:hypothetical protein [Paraliomyxa miuraensis]MCX4245713.1 hypothetical protein [Paraliomyxa miuraensis]
MRSLLLIGLLCTACSDPNPAFGEDSNNGKGGSATDGESSTSDMPPATTAATGSASVTVADATSDTNDTTDPPTDLPDDATCDLEPTEGLIIALGDPASFGGTCPVGFDEVPMRLSSINGDEVVLEQCDEGCDPCFGDFHTVAIPSLPLGEHIPGDTCLTVESTSSLGQTEMRCRWGALTIHDPDTDTPYVLATTASTPPTPNGASLLGAAVPDPVDAIFCECDTISLDHACCEQSGPSFLRFTIDGFDVLPGQETGIMIPNASGTDHSFASVQAQRLPCGDAEPMVSWAVIPMP